MQNGGMATGLAFGVLKSPAAALAAAVFGPWSAVSQFRAGVVVADENRRRRSLIQIFLTMKTTLISVCVTLTSSAAASRPKRAH